MSLTSIEGSQFNKFVQFATSAIESGKSKTIASLNALDGTQRTISARKGDYVGKIFRSKASKLSNNETRDMFRDSVIKLFGGISQIPDSVLDAMKLEDYEKGKPLTAHRIIAVKNAIDALKNDKSSQFDDNGVMMRNKKLIQSIVAGKDDELPLDILNAIKAVKSEVAARCGDAVVPSTKALMQMIAASSILENNLEERVKNQNRDITAEDVRSMLSEGLARDSAPIEHALLTTHIKELAQSQGNGNFNPTRYFVTTVFTAIPGLLDELKAAKTPDEIKTTLDKYTPQVSKCIRLSEIAKKTDNKAIDILVAAYKDATGIDEATIRASMPLRTFTSREAAKVLDKIQRGTIKVENEEEAEAAMRKAADDYVQARLNLGKEADGLKDISEAARKSLRFRALTADSLETFKIAEYASLAKKVNVSNLVAVTQKQPFDAEAVTTALGDVASQIVNLGLEKFGAEQWDNLGVDGIQPFGSIIFKCALSNNPDVIKTLSSHKDEIQNISFVKFANANNTQRIMGAMIPAIGELDKEM